MTLRPFLRIKDSGSIGLLFSLVFLALMVISSNSFFYLPYTPIPITTQTFTVLLSSIVLGSRLALITQLEFLALGIAGFPVFAGGKSGLVALAGPTGGYIIGFIVASYLTGYILERSKNSYASSRYEKSILVFFAAIIGLLFIYALGSIQLFNYLFLAQDSINPSQAIMYAFNLGVKPFIIFDIIKVLLIVVILKKIGKIKDEI